MGEAEYRVSGVVIDWVSEVTELVLLLVAVIQEVVNQAIADEE